MSARKKQDPPQVAHRITFAVTKNADGSEWTTEYEGVTYKGTSPLDLDKKLDKALVPRPRRFEVTPNYP